MLTHTHKFLTFDISLHIKDIPNLIRKQSVGDTLGVRALLIHLLLVILFNIKIVCRTGLKKGEGKYIIQLNAKMKFMLINFI